MTNNKNLLIVCHNNKDLLKIKKIPLQDYTNVIVASNDFNVHLACKKYHQIKISKWIDGIANVDEIANDTIKIIEIINEILKDFALQSKLNTDYLFWQFHVEGGKTAQIINDMLIYINNWEKLLNFYHITEVCFIRKNFMLYESVLIMLLKKRKIHYYYINKFSIPPLQNFKVLLKDFLRPLYKVLRCIFIRLRGGKSSLVYSQKNVVLLNCFSSELKHIDYIANLLHPLKNYDFSPIVFTWGINKQSVRRFFEGFSFVTLEGFLNARKIINLIYLFVKMYFIRAKISKILNTKNLKYRDYDLSQIILKYIEYYTINQVPENITIALAVKELLKKVKDIKFSLVPGLIALETSKIISAEIAKINPIFFAPVPFEVATNPYTEYIFKNNKNFFDNVILFTQYIRHKTFYIKNLSWKEENVHYVGKFKKYDENIPIIDSENILTRLNIPKSYEFIIAFDYSGNLMGIISMEELLEALLVLINFVRKHPNIALIIKPHPSADTSILIAILKDNKDVKNIYLIDKKQLPNDVLIISDVLVTKFSTIGVEAMRFGTIVVSYLFDNSERLKIYGDAAMYVYNPQELFTFLSGLLNNKRNFENLKKVYLEKNNKFLSEGNYTVNTAKDGFSLIAEKLKELTISSNI